MNKLENKVEEALMNQSKISVEGAGDSVKVDNTAKREMQLAIVKYANAVRGRR